MSEPVLTSGAARGVAHEVSGRLLFRPEQGKKLIFISRWLRTPWLNAALFLLTLASTTAFGFAAYVSFRQGHGLDDETLFKGYELLFNGKVEVWAGLAYSLPLLLILGFHEFGHYFTCRRWRVRATLPYFMPSPTFIGTLGAFIAMRSPIYRRRGLFDIGISGPIAGFAVLLPCLFIGVWNSRLCVNTGAHDVFLFGSPLLLRVLEAWRFPGVPASHICLHPMAVAAWAGMLATAMNLLPIGQLDGGHIVYATLGARWHKIISYTVVAFLVLATLLYHYLPWGMWAVVMFFLRRHPLVYDDESLGRGRQGLAVLAAVLLLLSFSIVPVRFG